MLQSLLYLLRPFEPVVKLFAMQNRPFEAPCRRRVLPTFSSIFSPRRLVSAHRHWQGSLKIIDFSKAWSFATGSLLSGTALPAPPLPEPSPSPEIVMQNYEGAFLKMFLTLIGLIVAIFFTIWALKRLSRGRLGSLNASRAIKILERRPLTPKTTLFLVEVNGKQALIAESQLEVKKLLEDLPTTEEES
jgi:flagellar biogenesis protein FliO